MQSDGCLQADQKCTLNNSYTAVHDSHMSPGDSNNIAHSTAECLTKSCMLQSTQQHDSRDAAAAAGHGSVLAAARKAAVTNSSHGNRCHTACGPQ